MLADVLIVDDNPEARRLLSQSARANGWGVQVQPSGDAALACLREAKNEGRRFDAIFLDWHMPDLDGWQTMVRMHQDDLTGGAKVVLTVSAVGLNQLSRRVGIDRAKVHAFLVKPLTANMMHDALVDQVRPRVRQSESGASDGGVPTLKDLRILVVEDNPNNQQIAQELLEDEGAVVTLADHGQDALEMLRRAPKDFDAVLMDVQMPVMDGFTATRHIRKDLALTELPIIAITANAMRSDREACMEAGMNEHVGKPFDVGELAGVLLRWTGKPKRTSKRKELATLHVPADLQEESLRDGFDAQEAMDRFLGKTDMFERLVNSFRNSAVTLSPDLSQSIQSGDIKAAIMRLHTFKGLAATLCARDLAAKASEGEGRLKDEKGLSDQWLHDLSELVSTSAPALCSLASKLSALVKAPQLQGASHEQPGLPALASELSELAENLKRADMAATDVIASIMQRHGDRVEVQLRSLDDAIMNLDFENALKLCEQHLQHLQAVQA